MEKIKRGLLTFSLMLLSVLAGCISINQPTQNQTLSSPVAVDVTWNTDMKPGTFYAEVDGVNVTAKFNLSAYRTATASLPLANGAHQLKAGGELWYFYTQGYSSTATYRDFNVHTQLPSLNFSNPSPITLNAGATVNLGVTTPAPVSSPLVVTLTPNNANIALGNAPAGTAHAITVAAQQNNAAETLRGVQAGAATVRASASNYQDATISVNVKPVISALNPNTGAPSSAVTINGQGFVAGASARFGNTPGATSFVSSNQLQTTVPSGLSGMVTVTVQAGGQTSNGVSFTVTASTPGLVVFRSGEGDVQAFDYTTSSASLIGSRSATLSPGMQVVGLSFNGSGTLVRASSGDVQTFGVNAAGQLAPGATISATLSPVGASVVALTNQVIRSSASDVQVFSLNGTALALQGAIGASLSSSGSAVDTTVISGRRLAVRVYGGGIEVFDITTPSAITLRGRNQSGALSPTGVGVKIDGTRAVRVHASGVEVYDLTSANPSLVASNVSGALSSTGVAVAADQNLGRIVRAYNGGIEFYRLIGTTLQRIGARGGALSPTGVAVALSGNRVFRAESGGVEEYDISNPISIPQPTRTNASLSSTGVGIALR
ncbi:MAG: IPT/TIG domain-containing protein [Burkholderiales bacterium]|nr:IPT/TIG domain-containing protein [Burkholderiales bacterium]